MIDENEPPIEGEDAAFEDEGVGAGGRQPVEKLWDDDGFRERVVQLCELRGVKPRRAMIGAGTGAKYLDPAPNGRNTNIVMRLAKYLGAHPAWLMFGPTAAPGPDGVAPGGLAPGGLAPGALAPGALADTANATPEQRVALIAQICTSYWLHVAVHPKSARTTGADTSLAQIAALVL